MVVAGLMSIVGLSITSVITNSAKSQKKVEQKDSQLGAVNYVRSLLQNPNFCKNAFCTQADADTCAASNINFLSTGGAVANQKVYAIQAFGTQAGAVATNALRCSSAAGQDCNDYAITDEPPTAPPFGTPVKGINGLYIYGMWLKDFAYQGTAGGGLHLNTASLLIQYAVDPKLTAGGKLRSSEINIYFKGDGSGNITDCSAGAVDTKWLDGPAGSIYYDVGNVGVGTIDPLRAMHIVGPKVADGDSNTQARIEDMAAYNANPQAGLHFANKFNAANQTTGMGAIMVSKENAVDGNTSSNMTFHTRVNAGAVAERVRITSAGNVGIGTNSPATRMHVQGTASAVADAGYVNFTDSLLNGLSVGYDTGQNWTWLYSRQAGVASRPMAFFTDGSVTTSPQFFVSAAGDVGVGTAGPGAKLDVVGNILLSGAGAKTISTDNGVPFGVNVPGNANFSVTTNGTQRLSIASTGIATFANNVIVSSGGVAITAGGLTVSAGGAAVSGNSSIAGTLSVSGALSAASTFSVAGQATIPTINGNINHTGGGDITGSNGDITGYALYQLSDQTLKKDITALPEQIDLLEQLGVYNFRYIQDQKNKKHIGLLAQEVQKFYPELVIKNKDGKLNVNYIELIPVLIKALQESNAKIEDLKNQQQQTAEQLKILVDSLKK